MFRRLCAAALLAAFCVVPAHAQAWSPEKTTLATVKMKSLVGPAAGQAPGVAVGVSINGNPVFATGAGEAFPGTPATEATAYQVGSLTKQLTAATMLALIEKKGGAAFSLETRVKDTLPDSFPFSKSGAETIRNLLSQRTGYARYTNPPAGAAMVPDGTAPIERQALRGYVYSLLRQFPAPALPSPGSKHSYNNTNYYLASLMIEKLGGFGDYRDAMKQYVFQPAGMTKSGFIGAPPAGVVMAKPPYDTTKSLLNKPDWPRGAGEVISNVNDFLKWHAALMGDKLFTKKSRSTMMSPLPGDTYAMGWWTIITPPYIWFKHNGIIPGYTSYDGIFFNASTNTWVSVVVLSNNDGVLVEPLAVCLAQAAMDPSLTLNGLGAIPKSACGISNKSFGLP
jgi:CubicO group peptidase (beta-lactamase class C family)